MKKFRLSPIIRKKSKYNSSVTYGQLHTSVPNYLDRDFKNKGPDQVYCTDITYLDYGEGKRAYLSAIKDAGTREIRHFNLAKSMHLNVAIEGIHEFYSSISSKSRKALIVHSDQGSHYTSYEYRSLLERLGILQSMSRKGKCLDNAPIESFFGHMKDELDYIKCKSYEELEEAVKQYIDYYNKERPQWDLNGKTPAECRGSNFGALY